MKKHSKDKENNIKNIAAFVIIGLLIGFTAALMTYSFWYVEKVRVYNMTLIVYDHIGFDVDNETLAFGMVMPGTASSTRFLNVANGRDYPVLVQFTGTGEMAQWVSLHNTEIVLDPYETREVRVSANPPAEVAYGNYTGKFKIVFKKII